MKSKVCLPAVSIAWILAGGVALANVEDEPIDPDLLESLETPGEAREVDPATLMPDHDYSVLEAVVIQEGGRKKPLLTFARESLLFLSGRTSFEIADGVKVEPMPFIASIWLSGRDWTGQPLILIDQADVKEALGLSMYPRRFSFREVVSRPALADLLVEIEEVREREGAEAFTDFQKHISDLGQRLMLFRSLQSGESFRVVPNPNLDDERRTWVTIPHGGHFYEGEAVTRLNLATIQLFAAYHGEELGGKDFVAASEGFLEVQWSLAPEVMPSERRIRAELWHEHNHVFRWAWILLLLGALTMGTTWTFLPKAGMLAGWTLSGIAAALMVLGMGVRVYIAERAPVTNLYETVVWVAFGLMFFGMLFEFRYRCRYYLLSAAVMGALLLLLSDSVPAVLDPSIAPLTAVLRDNFWLTTHVLTVTISYAAFALAFGLGHIPLIQQIVLGRRYRDNRALHAYVYRAVQVGILLLTVGVILGGVWANYSWGRFWGWDPKETWSLIAILTYLFVLHGRLVGWWKGWGMTVGAVLGFQSILMCWYGVNFIIGAGLHSYGFGSGGENYFYAFVAAQLLFVGTAMFRRWQCRRGPPGTATPGGEALKEKSEEHAAVAR